jgi:hypothetical protein
MDGWMGLRPEIKIAKRERETGRKTRLQWISRRSKRGVRVDI